MRKKDIYIAYSLPASAVGSSKLHYDFFITSAAAKAARILQLRFMSNLDVAATGVVAIRMDVSRTSAVGTGGTAFGNEVAFATATRSFSKLDPIMANIPSGVTMREAPAGGATAGAYLGSLYTFPEETAGQGYEDQRGNWADFGDEQKLIVPAGSGLRFDQGSVASVGTVGVRMVFELI